MSTTAITPVPFVNATSLVDIGDAQAQRHLQDDTQTAKAQVSSDVSSSGSAAVSVQAFKAFQPDVQPIASLTPTTDIPTQTVPPDLSASVVSSPTQWSGAIVDVYA